MCGISRRHVVTCFLTILHMGVPMTLLNGILLVLAGLGAMGFGLMIFYALLPLFYAFFGYGVGYWLGSLLMNSPPGEASFIKFLFAVAGCFLFAAAAYFLEAYRRILIGIGLGSLFGGLIASALGLTGFFGFIIMILAGVGGAVITLAVFDPFIIVTSATGGAGLALDGAHLILPSVGIFDRMAISQGAIMPLVLWIVMAVIGLGWQFTNIDKWTGRIIDELQKEDQPPPS